MSSVSFAQPDVTLTLDTTGVIRQASLANAISGEVFEEFVGRPWVDTVADGGTAQVRKMLEDARAAGVSFFHQVRQRFPSGLELPCEYTTVRLGGNAGLIAIGRNLEAVSELRSRLIAAQKSMERDYWKLREVETRYRLLFDASTQPVLLISADDTRIMEANPAAIRALGVASDHELLPEVLTAQRDAFAAMLGRVREQGKAPGIVLHLGPDRHPWLVRASLIAAEPVPVFVLQLSQSGAAPAAADRGAGLGLDEMLARLPDGFVVVDSEGAILRANRAFLDLIEQGEDGGAVGQRLGRWLCRPGADAGALLEILQRQRAISQFTTVLKGDLGGEMDVEIAAAGSADSSPRYIGVLLRRVPVSGEAAERPGDLVGKATLRDIVQVTVSTVERQCIEAALAMSKGNRTAAAEMLGLSRQSLYAKLGRYQIDTDGQSGSK